jgi:hypothetical protein
MDLYAWVGLISLAVILAILTRHFRQRQRRLEAERERRVVEHCLKHAMSWSIETQNDRTPFMKDFQG